MREGEPTEPAGRRIDLGEAYVLPGAIDCHVHSGSHAGEGIGALTASAAAGGVTTVIDMPYDVGAPVASPEVLAAKRDKVRTEAIVDVGLLGTVRPGTGASDVAPLVEAGAVGFKLSLFGTDPHRLPRIPDDQLLEVLACDWRAGECRLRACRERRDHKAPTIQGNKSGESSPLGSLPLCPPVSETQAVLTALEYARDAASTLHLCHLSLARSVDLARSYAEEGLREHRDVPALPVLFRGGHGASNAGGSRSTRRYVPSTNGNDFGKRSRAVTSTSSLRIMPHGRFRTRPARRSSRTTQVPRGPRPLFRSWRQDCSHMASRLPLSRTSSRLRRHGSSDSRTARVRSFQAWTAT